MTDDAPIAISPTQDAPLRRSLVLGLAIAGAATVFAATLPFATSARGVVGPTIADAARPVAAAVAVVVAFAVATALSAIVARLVNACVGLFVLGCGVGFLSMRSGAVAEFAFGGSSIGAAAAELAAWTVLAVGACHLVFRTGGALPDLPPTHEDDLDRPAGRAARSAWFAACFAPLVAWAVAVNDTKGQALFAATMAGFATGAVGRIFAPRTNPVYLAAAPVAVFAALFAYLAFTLRGDLAAGFVDGSLPNILRLMPADVVAGSFAGTALGFGFMRSFLAKER
jgi:hypothetical protein